MTTRLFLLLASAACAADVPPAEINALAEKEYAPLETLYRELHAAPELSFREEKTSARLAGEIRQLGWEVTERVGGFGVVAVRKNGPGPTVLVRCDMDALPVREMTGLPYASKVTAKDDEGREVPVMHACGHDVHMSAWVGVARILEALRERWRGTLVFIAQPAEEKGGGARAMLDDGLFRRFPKPDYCLALHVNSELPAGVIGYREGPMCANVDSVDILVQGRGGHGAQPHSTKDPIVLAAQMITAFQTIDSRELHPLEPIVVTVGSIHGGTKHNIIPDSVKLQLTVRTFSDEVRQQTLDAIRRIARGLAVAAGLPEGLMPEVKVTDEFTPVLVNDAALTKRTVAVFTKQFGPERVRERKPTMGGEDFGRYGRTEDRIPISMFIVGAVDPAKIAESEKTGVPLPSAHSPFFAPMIGPTLKTSVAAMTAAVLDLLEAR
jgi:hippurate hydrolase